MKPNTTLIVLAHPERHSFNAQWACATADAAAASGHKVAWSDLYAMGFDPAEGPHHYQDQDPRPFDALDWQDEAWRNGTLPSEVTDEIEKIRAADLVVFHFPLWWFGPPAMLKGWFERVLVHGALHTSTHRFDRGLCLGKRALFCVSTGSSAAESSPHGKEGDVNLLLWPLAYSLRYLGFTILHPETIHGVHGFKKGAEKEELSRQLGNCLADQQRLISDLGRRPAWKFNTDDAFDRDGTLKPGEPCYWPFIRPGQPPG